VILVPPGVRILLAAQPVDFRKGMDGLAALVQQVLRADRIRPVRVAAVRT
jgi:transposase